MSDRTVWEVSTLLREPTDSSKVCIVAHHGDKYDEMLVLDGNFEGYDEKKARAQEICDQLNGGRIDAPDVMRTKVQLSRRLDEIIKALEFDGGPASSLLMSIKHDLFASDSMYPLEFATQPAQSGKSPVTFEYLKQMIKESWQLTNDEVALMDVDTKFVDVGFDSLDMVEMILMVEDEYSIEFYDEDVGEIGADKITTPRHLLELIKQKVQARG